MDDETDWMNELGMNDRVWDFFLDEEDKDEQEKNRLMEYYDDYSEYLAELEHYEEEWMEFEIGYDVMCAHEDRSLYKWDYPLYFDNLAKYY
jgi:hypothetical protein